MKVTTQATQLSDYKAITATAAEELSHHSGTIRLNGVTVLTDGAAKWLGAHRGALYLSGVVQLSDVAAAHLVVHEGELHINLRQIPQSAASILRRHPTLAAAANA